MVTSFISVACRAERADPGNVALHAILVAREATYDEARIKRPDRWTGSAHNWEPVVEVRLLRVHGNPAEHRTAS